jgi:hypothetical protein
VPFSAVSVRSNHGWVAFQSDAQDGPDPNNEPRLVDSKPWRVVRRSLEWWRIRGGNADEEKQARYLTSNCSCMAAGSKSESRSQGILMFRQRQLSWADEENRRGLEPSFVTLS